MAAIEPRTTRVAVKQLAERQYGIIGRDQALAAGVSPAAIKHYVNSEQWTRVHKGVYAIAGSPETWHQSLIAACLLGGDGTLASHRSAAALLKLSGFAPGPIDLSTTRNLRRTDISVHRVASLPRADVIRVAGIPCTDPARTLIDLASILDEEPLEITFHEVLFHLISLSRLIWRLDFPDMKTKAGVGLLRRWVEELGPNGRPSQTGLEVRTYRLLVSSDLPPPVRQYPVVVSGRNRYIDLAYPGVPLAIETDGYRYHHGKVKWESDRIRSNELQAAGWQMIFVTDERLKRDPNSLVALARGYLGRSGLL